MNIGNFLKEILKEWPQALIFALIAALIVDFILKGPIRKFFASIWKLIRKQRTTKKFEQKYRDWMVEKYKFLQVRGIKTNASVAIELEKIFISLRTKKPAERIRFSEIESKIEEGIDKLSEIEEFNRREFLKRRIEERETEKTYELKDLFKLPQKRFIIIGAPGSGKTTLLNYLALKFARQSAEELFGMEDEKLPIFINLRDAKTENFLDVKKFTENYKNYMDVANCPQDFFEKRLEDGKCIFLLDGLDEVAKDEERKRVAKWVDELATTYYKNLFISTSRPYGYETSRLYNDFLELHILDFTPEQVEEFIRYWTKAVEIKLSEDESEFTLKEAEKKADDLLKAIKENPKIEVLTVNPLLLTIVSLVHRYRATLPKRRVELYEECCDVLLGYWDTSKGLAGELEPRKKRTVLQPLAYHLHLKGLREEKREKFIELLENELPKIGVPKEKADDFLQDIRYRCGIVVEIKLGYFGFSHPTFQEFLTARYILDNDLENFLLSKKRDKYWLEVTLLYCGMKDTTNLLQNILNGKEDIFHTNIFLAGRCLVESLSIHPELRDLIVQNLIDIYLDEDEFGVSKKIASEILKEVKNQKIVLKLMEFLKNKDGYVRQCAADVLGQIQAKEAILPLIELLKDKESNVRRSAASTLGELQAKEAVYPLIELLNDKESNVIGRVASALGQIQAKEAILPLIELLQDKESDIRRSAASALGQIQAKEAAIPLIGLLMDKESSVRGSAASALGQIQAKEATSHLLELLKDKDRYVRWRAADALGEIRAKESVLSLLELLKDKDREVRTSAADALGQIQAKQAVAPLLELLKDKEREVRASAAYALGLIRTKEAVVPLIELLMDQGSGVRETAAVALGEIQAKEAVVPLMELLKDKDWFIRRRAASALGEIGDKCAVESLMSLLTDMEFGPRGQVRNFAFNALKQISEKTGIPIYRE